mgnify:FL=1
MRTEILISVIIPQRGNLDTLGKLFDSIPNRNDLEILVVDNTPVPVTKENIAVDRNYILLWSAPERHAGGARNVGMENAKGRWLIFADADDYFAEGAFDVFYSKIDSDADIVYTCMGGAYIGSDEKCDRGKEWTALVMGYIDGTLSEEDLKTSFTSPCCKMVRRELVEKHHLKYDEIRAGNDGYFSITSAYFARKIEAVPSITYIATLSKGTLTRRIDKETTSARLYGKLHCNKFLREHGMGYRQRSILLHLYESRKYGLINFLKLLAMVCRFRQNPFVGLSRIRQSYSKMKFLKERDKRFIVK